jgi:acyl carrier protein
MRPKAQQTPQIVFDETEIKKRIHQFILAKLLIGEESVNLTDTTPLVSGGVINSLNALKLGLFLEKTFMTKLDPEELANPENIETIKAIANLVLSKIRKGG